MKRDPDLIRKILTAIEAAPDSLNSTDIQIEGFSYHEIVYQIKLLLDKGLIRGKFRHSVDGEGVYWIERLTWEGHDFIEAARNEKNWQKAKEIMASTGGFVLELARPLLLELIKQQLKLP